MNQSFVIICYKLFKKLYFNNIPMNFELPVIKFPMSKENFIILIFIVSVSNLLYHPKNQME